MQVDLLLTRGRLVSAVPSAGSDVSRRSSLQTVDDGALGIRGGRIAWLGSTAEAEAALAGSGGHLSAHVVTDLGHRLVTPGLIDCHTHAVFSGSRAHEWERRLAGETYAEISRTGGGIGSTVAATRDAPLEELVEGAVGRLQLLAGDGVTTVEVKSGYGLEDDTELRMLEAAERAATAAGMRVERTLLAAHAVPREYAGRPDAYLDDVVLPLISRAAAEGRADAVDAFCEEIAFTPVQVRRVFAAARAVGLPVRLHADQLTDGGGAALAAACGALSADHLEYTSADGVRAMAAAGTVAVLLPGAWLHLGAGPRPPVEALRGAGVPLAVATDANPGSSPLLSLLTAAHLACAGFGLTVAEALLGITRNAARALGRLEDRGTLEVGKWADLAVWDAHDPADLLLWIGRRPLHRRMLGGRWM